jgi:hypothetical protein
MSHSSCHFPDPGPAEAEDAQSPPAAQGQGFDGDDGASYECVNDCVSSMGAPVLLSGAATSLGCLVVPPACPVFIGTSVGSILGACEAACDNLESKP